ncbi:MAG: aminomethyl-transferring glycine dehydrogenase [Betaproteobacteria bacterium]|nr:aminomethyl-transferring glycine dehydrogenase [Betaproteobacteria bacterium]MBK8688741.1 aminomethyl-transferring glycine dehydrogenase [Betaproteobacteria bacterium]MBK9674818.1 aminomethyl-transferring glycine dehydrogenase [Betaproteobacteria bacterium]
MNEPLPSESTSAGDPLTTLEQHDAFIARHIGTTPADQAEMLAVLGQPSRAALMDAIVPAGIRRAKPLALPAAMSEAAALAKLKSIAARNRVLKSYIGQGYYGTWTPGVILRNILENPAWYTAYTPYQPEISQGRLEALVNFQTMICDLTGMAIANASMLDEATAAAEAMTLCQRMGAGTSRRFYVADDCFPQTLDVVRTRAEPLGIEVVVGPAADAASAGAFGVLLQYPGADGEVRDDAARVAAVHAAGGFVVVAADLLALTLLKPPGEWGADVVVGSAQRFGVPMGYGGPHAGYLATRDDFKRSMPGRLVGVTVDAAGNPAYRLALQTREQHIRREKATSNICTAQVLLAVIAGMYAVYHGPEGLKTIARRVHRLTAILKAGLERLGFTVPTAAFFDTLTVATGARTRGILDHGLAFGVNFRRIDDATLGISLDETTDRADVERIWQIFAGDDPPFAVAHLDAAVPSTLPTALLRTTAFLGHPVFNRCHSETEMLRYLRRLADRDIALDRAMIPLGSCTMKLNATAEMIPITWREFAHLHPFAPADQAEGYRELVADLERMLCAATGYAAVSLQPNAGSQGEYAGLLVIRAWHRSRGQGHRNVCLIPASAHGTNPASAHMAGMQVVVVACDQDGNVDLADLEAKARAHSADLAAIMVTYPSTHGVFEAGIRRACEIVHEHGGQVYVDGANLNALVGLAAPGEFGADVSHLNLHKTFCIPHGGGGPGVGPIGVAAHLARFLPGHRAQPRRAEAIGPVAAAPCGSASILPISWMYIAMMGGEGLTAATESAILAANYVARRLNEHYPVLYSGPGGLVAHECILDLRALKETSGIAVDDVAKRLMDYGFHAPTMSFPVAGTLMVEPTESEPKGELDRFVDAMIAIREEIRAVEQGRADRGDNPLKHAPHTASAVCADEWRHAYGREQAAFPMPGLRAAKYWPPVGRVDNVHGDRHLFCSCIPVAEY